MKAKHLSGSVLAFIGDAILTLKVREFLVAKGFSRAKDLQEKSIIFVGAVGQAKFMQNLLATNILSENELYIYKRGRNANMTSVAKNVDVVSYRVASGFEALLGYLYYEDQGRLNDLFAMMIVFYDFKFNGTNQE